VIAVAEGKSSEAIQLMTGAADQEDQPKSYR
jgi:hypothetical protein